LFHSSLVGPRTTFTGFSLSVKKGQPSWRCCSRHFRDREQRKNDSFSFNGYCL